MVASASGVSASASASGELPKRGSRNSPEMSYETLLLRSVVWLLGKSSGEGWREDFEKGEEKVRKG